METILDVNQVALQVFVQLVALEWPRDDAQTPRQLAQRAFDIAEEFLDVAAGEAAAAAAAGV